MNLGIFNGDGGSHDHPGLSVGKSVVGGYDYLGPHAGGDLTQY